MPSQCSRLQWDQGPAVFAFGTWKDLFQGNWLSLLCFSSLSATYILHGLGVSHHKSQRTQNSHFT